MAKTLMGFELDNLYFVENFLRKVELKQIFIFNYTKYWVDVMHCCWQCRRGVTFEYKL